LLSQAQTDYRHSIELFEKLLAERPDDRETRSWFADALGEWGYGFFLQMTGKPAEAEPHYRRSIQLRRDLVVDPLADAPSISHDLSGIGIVTGKLAFMLSTTGRTQEAEKLLHDLTQLAKRSTDQDTLRDLATTIGQYGGPLLQQNLRKEAADISRLALTIDPKNANFLNNLAWALASFPDAPCYSPAEALEAARKAVTLEPENGTLRNTLGVAAYRVGDWKTASEALEKSMSLNKGGDANDWFFLAMTRWRQNNKAEARKWYDQAVAWTRKNSPDNPELKHFQEEAALLLESGTPPGGSKPTVKR
jgi:tetratricopeptide (TPR) repeat protein